MSSRQKGKNKQQQGGRQKGGGTSRPNSSAASSSSSSSSSAAPAPPPASPEELLSQVEELIESSDLSAAERLIRSPSILGSATPNQITSTHAPLIPFIELLAQVLLARSKSKEAFEWLRACCILQPDGGAEKWMYYGQLIGGKEALQAFKQGIGCMFKTRSSLLEKLNAAQVRAAANTFTMGEFESVTSLNLQVEAIGKAISSGYTSMSELYVTDLCDEPQAESECEKLLGLALSACPSNPDALYQIANLRTIQERVDEAKQCLTKLLDAIAAYRSHSIETMPILASTSSDVDADESLGHSIGLHDVSYELRIAAAKLALELEENERALELLEQLFEEDDRIIEVSHLAAVCAFNLSDFVTSSDYLNHALQLIATEQDDEMGEESEAHGASEQEEIDTTKRALMQLKVQVDAGLKNMPAVEENEEEEDQDDEEAEEEEEEQKGGEAKMTEDANGGDSTMQD